MDYLLVAHDQTLISLARLLTGYRSFCSPNGAELADVLGADPMEAAQFAAELLSQPHPLVAAGAGVWVAPAVATPVIERWRDGLAFDELLARYSDKELTLLVHFYEDTIKLTETLIAQLETDEAGPKGSNLQ
jgi:hypothetical protein